MSELSFYDLTYEGPVVQAILDTAQKLRTEGYIFMGAGTPSTVPGTPTERVWYLCGPGTYANFGSSVTVPEGSVMVAQYASGWTKTVIEIGSAGGGTFATGEEVGDVSLFDDVADLTGKTEAEKALMLPNGAVVEQLSQGGGGEIKTTIDLTELEETGISSGSSKSWTNNYKGKFLPVRSGEVYDLIPPSGKAGIIIPLKVCIFKNATSYESNIATGFSDRVIISTTYRFTVPSDCTCLYMQATSGSGAILPTVVKVEQSSPLADTPTAGSEIAVSSDGVYRFASYHDDNIDYNDYLPLVLIVNNTTRQIEWSTGSAQRGCRIYNVSGGEYVHVKANASLATYVVFLSALGAMTNGSAPSLTSARFVLQANAVLEMAAPAGTNYMYVYRVSESGSHLPSECWIYRPVANAAGELLSAKTKKVFDGQGMSSQGALFAAKQGRIYRITFDRTTWETNTISATYVILRVIVGSTYLVDLRKGDGKKMGNLYYIRTDSDTTITVSFRGDTGAELSMLFEDVTDNYNRKAMGVSFVDDGAKAETMMVKVSNGDLVRWSAYNSASTDAFRIYSRCIQDSTYLVDKVTATGLAQGEFMPLSDAFVVVTGGTGTTPTLEVYNEGRTADDVVEPYQFIADTANKMTIISSTDAGATGYDNKVINAASILQKDDGTWLMWYQGFGSTGSSYICMATSSDGMTWTRGVPSGTTPWYANTNVVIGHGHIVGLFTNEMVNEFTVCKVSDSAYPYRLIGNIRNADTNLPKGEKMWIMKSADGVTWIPLKQITGHAHDSLPCAIVYGNIIKVYLRMWDFAQATNDQRMVGVMYVDLDGNAVMPPSGIFGHGLYNSGASQIGHNRDLLIPTHYYPSDECNYYEAYIVEGRKVRSCPSYGLSGLKDVADNDGWGWTMGIVTIGMQDYIVYSQRDTKHNVSATKCDIRLCPINWITYDSYNTDGE